MGVATPGLCGSGQQQQSRVDVDFEGVMEDDISGKNNSLKAIAFLCKAGAMARQKERNKQHLP